MSPEAFQSRADPDNFRRVLGTKKLLIIAGTPLLLITALAAYIGLYIDFEENKDSSLPTPTPAEDFNPKLDSDFQTITIQSFKFVRE